MTQTSRRLHIGIRSGNFIHLKCDGCGAVYSSKAFDLREHVDGLLEEALTLGWRACNGIDTCPACLQREQERAANNKLMAHCAEQERLRQERLKNYVHPSRERNVDIFTRVLSGEDIALVGRDFSLSAERIRQICAKERKRQKGLENKYWRIPVKGRVIDMGGPRDVWHVWTPEMTARELGLI